MFPKERRKEILEIVNATGFATVDDLSKRFGVSVDSIRKDPLIINFIRTPPTFIRTCADECGNPIP